jgi:hypothetical protein
VQLVRLKLSPAQIDRSLFIDLRLRFIGDVRRQDLVNRFGLQTAAATRDLTQYRVENDGNMAFDSRTKVYFRLATFQPLYPEVSATEALTWMQSSPGHQGSIGKDRPIPIEVPLVNPKIDVDELSVISRAIRSGQAIEMRYRSMTKGLTSHDVVPHALIDLGDRWYMRTFDRQHGDFRDFCLSRVVDANVIAGETAASEKSTQDIDWNNIVRLELVPHPVNVPNAETLKSEFDVVQGVLRVECRAALAIYLLRRMSVDCSERHRLRGASHQWWLKNRQALQGLPNLELAPGYFPEKG